MTAEGQTGTTAGDAQWQCAMEDLCREGDEFTAQDNIEAMHWYRLDAAQRWTAAP